jgi:undecaprenyl-diphosphatase
VWLPGAAGLGCLVAVVALGLVVRNGATPVDEAAWRGLHGLLAPQRLTWQVVGAIGHERGPARGVYLTAALPLLLAATLAAAAVGRLRRDWSWSALWPPAWRWLGWSCILLCSVPLVEALRLAFDRPDPTESPNPKSPLGSYPSGAALLVALGWIVGGTVIVRLRPSWRRPLVAAGVVALAVHAAARVAVGAHWLTDVLGSYLLAAGMALLAVPLRPRRGNPCPGP